MKKKGFTLIEIILAIALIAVIGTSSVVGFNLINKNIRTNKLSQITENVLRAAEVYIETNKETKFQIYNNKNGAIIPLNVLVNEGLLTLDNTDLTKNDIKDEYVITMLSEENGDCINLKTITSWNESSNEPIYICSKSAGTGGNSELEDRINYLEKQVVMYGLNGTNNYVLFDVNSEPGVTFPTGDRQDVWRIVDITEDEIKLLYDQNLSGGYWSNFDLWQTSEKLYLKGGSKKNTLYNLIKADLRDSILEKNYKYSHQVSVQFGKVSDMYMSNSTYADKFGSFNMGSDFYKFKETYEGKTLIVGDYIIGRDYNFSYGYVYLNNGELLEKVVDVNSYDYMSERTYSYNYVPLITISYDLLLISYSQYPDSYKNNSLYSGCDNSKLGKSECPRIIKLNDTLLSWGN